MVDPHAHVLSPYKSEVWRFNEIDGFLGLTGTPILWVTCSFGLLKYCSWDVFKTSKPEFTIQIQKYNKKMVLRWQEREGAEKGREIVRGKTYIWAKERDPVGRERSPYQDLEKASERSRDTQRTGERERAGQKRGEMGELKPSCRVYSCSTESWWNTRVWAVRLWSGRQWAQLPSFQILQWHHRRKEDFETWKAGCSLSNLKREQERALKFVQCSPSTISLFLPLASRHLSDFWKDVKKFNHYRGRERERNHSSSLFCCFFWWSVLPPVRRERACCFCVGVNRPVNLWSNGGAEDAKGIKERCGKKREKIKERGWWSGSVEILLICLLTCVISTSEPRWAQSAVAHSPSSESLGKLLNSAM